MYSSKSNPCRPPLLVQQSNTMLFGSSFGCDQKNVNINTKNLTTSSSALHTKQPTKTKSEMIEKRIASHRPSVSMSVSTPPSDIPSDFHCRIDDVDDDNNDDNNNNNSNMFQFLNKLSKMKDDTTLQKHGYTKVRNICTHSLQGIVFEAEKRIKTEKGRTKIQRVAIKKVSKELYAESISMEDGMSFIVEEDILKESVILNMLTVVNRPPADYIAKFTEFFEDDFYFYLVMEYSGDCNLLQFVNKAHEYLKEEKLSLREYQKMVKYLFWQIMVIINWLHNDINCCHLDLCMENIIVKHGDFIRNNKQNGTVIINPKISIKIADFGCSEIFKHNNFQCGKTTLTGNYQYCAPQVYQNILYDARKADIYQLGCILYNMSVGQPLYKYQDSRIDDGFLCIEHQNIEFFLKSHQLLSFVNKKLIKLLNGMLNTNEIQRVDSKQVLTHQWFQVYFKKYKKRIQTASEQQQKANKRHRQKMKQFPYYTMNENGY